MAVFVRVRSVCTGGKIKLFLFVLFFFPPPCTSSQDGLSQCCLHQVFLFLFRVQIYVENTGFR